MKFPPLSRICLLAFAAILLAGCEDWSVTPPEKSTAGQPTVSVPVSYAQIPISVRTADVEQAVLAEAATKPLFAGKTDEISAKLLVDEDIPAIMEDVVVTPFKAAGCVTTQVIRQCPQNTVRRIKESCLKGFPPKPWDCFRDITVTIMAPCAQDVTECWPEVKEVIESRVKIAAYVKEQTLPTSVWINYSGRLAGLDLEASGKSIAINARIDTTVSVDIKQGILGASMKVKGALKCDATFTVMATIDTTITPEAAIDLRVTKFDLDANRLCVPGAVELADLSMLNLSRLLRKEVFMRLLEKPLLKFINKKLKSEVADDLNFRDEMNRLGVSLRDPIDLKNKAWLLVNPKRLVVTQFSGSGTGAENELALNVAFEAKPEIVFDHKPESSAGEQTLEFNVAEKLGSGIHLIAKGSVDLDTATNMLKTELDKTLNEKFPNSPYTLGKVGMYQSGEKFVISLSFVKRGETEEKGTIYLLAVPHLNVATSTLRVRDVEFDLSSKNAVAKAAAWLLSGEIEKAIQDKAKWSYEGDLKRLQSDIGVIRSSSKAGSFEGQVDEINPRAIWISDNSLNLIAEASGSGSFRVNPGQ